MTSPALPTFFNMTCSSKGDQFSTDFYLYNDQMFQVLNSRITIYGLNLPSFTSEEVAQFPPGVPPGTVGGVIFGTAWYNITLDKVQFQGKTAIQTIEST